MITGQVNRKCPIGLTAPLHRGIGHTNLIEDTPEGE